MGGGGGPHPDRVRRLTRRAASVNVGHVRLRYLYVGSDDTGLQLAAWLALPGARLRWRFAHFGSDVAAVDIGGAPTVLLADHRPAGSVLPIFDVDDLGPASAALAAAGWTLTAGPLGTPEGPAALLGDGAGVEIALLQVDRPGVLERAFADQGNRRVVRGG